jgi:ribosomal protein S18 acetylase RimI-like enzyme
MGDDVALSARPASPDDVATLVSLYRGLEAEQADLKAMWPLADGLAEPVAGSLADAIGDPEVVVILGEVEGYPFGFALARVEPLLPQAAPERVGSIRLIYTEPAARGVGLGEVMIKEVLERLRSMGLGRFDAHVLPGHRLAKNFFEASGFAARSIVMYHEDP